MSVDEKANKFVGLTLAPSNRSWKEHKMRCDYIEQIIRSGARDIEFRFRPVNEYEEIKKELDDLQSKLRRYEEALGEAREALYDARCPIGDDCYYSAPVGNPSRDFIQCPVHKVINVINEALHPEKGGEE